MTRVLTPSLSTLTSRRAKPFLSKALAIIKFANDREDKGVSITSTYVFLMCFVEREKARIDFEACTLFWRPPFLKYVV